MVTGGAIEGTGMLNDLAAEQQLAIIERTRQLLLEREQGVASGYGAAETMTALPPPEVATRVIGIALPSCVEQHRHDAGAQLAS